MDIITVLGIAAGTLTTASYLPQVVRAWRTRHTRDISGYMFLLLIFGITLWLVYGIAKRDIPVIFANGISFVFTAVILYFKVKYG